MEAAKFDLGSELLEQEKQEKLAKLVPVGLFSDYLSYVRPFSESPPEFHIFTLAHTISCLIGRGCWIQQGEDVYYPNLFTLIVAPSSLFKKTSSTGLCQTWLGRLEHFNGRYLGHVGSPEGLFNGLQKNKGMGLLYYSEFGLLLAQSAAAKYMGGILDLLNDLYDCPDRYSKTLAGGIRKAKNVFLNVLVASQLESLTRYVKESTLLSGFLPRFTVVYSENLQSHISRRPIPEKKLQNKILKQLNDVRERAQKAPQNFDLTDEAWELFEAWGQERHKDARVADPKLQPLYGRIESHCLKYSIIIHMATDPDAVFIGTETISSAIAWSEFVISSYGRLVIEELTFNENDRRLKKVADIIKAKGIASKREVMIGTRYKNRDLEEMIRTLTVMGRVRQGKGPRGGLVYEWVT